MTALSRSDSCSPAFEFHRIAFRLDHSDIFNVIFDCCTPQALFRLRRTSTHLRAAVDDYLHRKFNIEKLMGDFFDDPLAFRSLQKSTDAIISGSSALQFFDRMRYPTSDMDIFVSPKFALATCEHILSQTLKTYTFVPNGEQEGVFARAWDDFQPLVLEAGREIRRHVGDDDKLWAQGSVTAYGPHALQVFSFVSPVAGGRKIDVIVSRVHPLANVMNFHSTVVMNFITFKAAYSLFPRATFEDKIALAHTPSNDHAPGVIEKYEQRGWRVIHQIPEDPQHADYGVFHYGSRWTADESTWIIPFDCSELPNTSDGSATDCVGIASFDLCLGGRPESTDLRYVSSRITGFDTVVVTNLPFYAKLPLLVEELRERENDSPLLTHSRLNILLETWNAILRKHCTCPDHWDYSESRAQEARLCPAFSIMAKVSRSCQL